MGEIASFKAGGKGFLLLSPFILRDFRRRRGSRFLKLGPGGHACQRGVEGRPQSLHTQAPKPGSPGEWKAWAASRELY